jgi:hypothetical protein
VGDQQGIALFRVFFFRTACGTQAEKFYVLFLEKVQVSLFDFQTEPNYLAAWG